MPKPEESSASSLDGINDGGGGALENVTLLLQPVFLDVQNNQSRMSSLDQGPSQFFDASQLEAAPFRDKFPVDASEDALYSMWKVATKVKAVMADGARFENLTWRAWYRKNQLERLERDQRRDFPGDTPLLPHHGHHNDDDHRHPDRIEKDEPISVTLHEPAQATAIPRQNNPLATRPLHYNHGYSSILAEIQEAGLRRGSMEVFPSSKFSGPTKLSPTESCATCSSEVPSKSTATNESECSADSNRSTSSIATNNIKASTSMASTGAGSKGVRRRKKNIDKFIKKQQTNLERIQESLEEPRPYEEAQMFGGTEAQSLDSTTVSAESALDLEPQFAREGARMRVSSTPADPEQPTTIPLFRRPTEPARRGTLVEKQPPPNVSLLTALLSRTSLESKRPDSCPPPPQHIFSTSPPCRPSAPQPIFETRPLSDHDLRPNTPPTGHQTTSLTALPGNASPVSSQSEVASDASLGRISEGLSATNSTASGQMSRRRPPPNPPEFTAPLYIW